MKMHVTEDGWLRVPYAGPEMAVIEVQLGAEWKPAYLDYEAGLRVAQVRYRGPLPAVLPVRVNGEIIMTWRP